MQASIAHDLLFEEIQEQFLLQIPFLKMPLKNIGWCKLGLSKEKIIDFEMALKKSLAHLDEIHIQHFENVSSIPENNLDAFLLIEFDGALNQNRENVFNQMKKILKPNGFLSWVSLSSASFTDFQNSIKPWVKTISIDGQHLAEIFQKNQFQDTVIHAFDLFYQYKKIQTIQKEWSDFLDLSSLENAEKQLFFMGKMQSETEISDEDAKKLELSENNIGLNANIVTQNTNHLGQSENNISHHTQSIERNALQNPLRVNIQLLFVQTFAPDLQNASFTTQTPNETRIGLAKLRQMLGAGLRKN